VDQLHLLSVILESQGFDVTAASNGLKALELLKNNEYRMMITDLNMPKMNGIELAAQVKKQHPDTRVVLVTADAFPGIIGKAVSAGIYEILSKPLDFRRLVATIRSSLSGLEVHSTSARSRYGDWATRAAPPAFHRRHLDGEVRTPKGR
jgi:two-component system response regulator PilR (NtrC family)